MESNNKWFWILQTLGWGIIAGTGTWAKLSFATETNHTYIFLEGLIIFCSGVLVSTALRYYLKSNINLDAYQNINYPKLIVVFITCIIAFVACIFVSVPTYNHFHDKNLEISNVFLFSQFTNSFLFFFFWLLLYFGIKIAFKFRKEKIEKIELETSLKESQLNTLKGQINPHFMFNSLNNIRGLMLEDVEKSRDMITRLSDMLRYSLTKNNLDTIALEEELEMADNYIALSKIQLEDRLEYQQEVSEDLAQVKIPPMLIQMLIENAIKHGISKQVKGGKVALLISEKNHQLVISVRNTGALVSETNSTKVGLNNITKRLALLYGNNANFSITESNNEVLATIQIPLK